MALRGLLNELVEPQPHTSATSRRTLCHGAVGFPVAQGPKQQLWDRSTLCGIPQQGTWIIE